MDSDISDVPLRMLRINTRKLVSDSLNSTKVFRSNEGLCRDWRGFAHLCGVQLTNCGKNKNPMEEVFTKWQETGNANVRQLLLFLEKLDRYDVITDVEVMINEDVQLYLQASERIDNYNTETQIALNSKERQILTIDDVQRSEIGLEPQMYDAVVLYDDKEWEVAQTLVNQLERDNFKLCLKDRDIVPGVNFEHETFMTLIKERCNRVVILLSPNFLQCPFNNFLQLYAQAVSIEERQRKVIPCLYKFPSKKDVPKEFRFYTMLSYDDLNRWPEIFWKRLRASIATESTTVASSSNRIESGVKIEELPSTGCSELVTNEIKDGDKTTETCSWKANKKHSDGILMSETSLDKLGSFTQSCDTLKGSIRNDFINETEKKRTFSRIRKLFKTLTSSKSSNSSKESRKKHGGSKCALMAN